ncbi:MAG: LGFP repeat-containing protein [Humibacter sp.]
MTPVSRLSRPRRLIGMLAVLVAVAGGLVATVAPIVAPSATAADAKNFQDGYLISDRNFFDSGSMTASEVQSFLGSKVARCTGANGYPCLKDYRAASIPATPASTYCSAVPGGSMSAAEIIVTVAQACGLSPKVILVMLQKEQGLVTATSPTEWNYRAAMGQGCPDGAACDPNAAGFFNQVYGAARQFQIYIKFPRSFGYQLGWNNILYQATPPDTNRVCGTKRVNILNDATRALYIYTPYTPNQAALDNLYGTGDSCSSYGNRNFWRLYTDWFGDPTAERVTGEYAAAWNALGGASGVLGPATGDVVCINSRYCQQSFRGGTIFWFPGRGVFGVPAVVESIWRNLGFVDGNVGFPSDLATCVSTGTCTQSFDGGIIAADGIGGSLVGRRIEAAWRASGGITLGGARGPELCAEDGTRCAQMFAHGAFYASGALASTGVFFDVWNARGMASGYLGYPLANVACTVVTCYQEYQGGTLVGSPSNGVVVVSGEYRDRWIAAGGLSGSLGIPLANDSCDGRSCSQPFQNGVLAWTPQHGMVTVSGWFLAPWQARGAGSGWLGAPTGGAMCDSATCYQVFQGGTLVGSPSNGVVAVQGQYRDVWLAAGGTMGSLGLPMGNDSCNGKSCSQSFQNGTLVWTSQHGMVTVSGWFLAPWQARGAGSGWLGAPTDRALCDSATCYQVFQGGTLVGSPSNGVVAVQGEYRDVWLAAGGTMGSLGLPLSNDSCDGERCSQAFQKGVLVWTPAQGMRTVAR